MTQRRRLLILLLAATTLLAAPAFAGVPGVTLEVVPSVSFVPPGGSVDVDVVMSGLGNLSALSLGGFDLVLQFDPAVFAFTGVAFGPWLGNLPAEAITSSMVAGGGLTVLELSLLTPVALNALQADTFSLFTATFDASGIGSGVFDVVLNAPLSDENGRPLTLDGIIPATVDTGSALDIPTLGPWGLLLLSLLLLGAGAVALRRMN